VCFVVLRVLVVAFGLVKFFTRYDILPASVGDNGPFAMADKDDSESPLTRSARALQHTAEQAGPAIGASYGLIGAIIVLGGIGYAVDSWQGTSPWFLIGGLMLGIVVGMYELAKTVWHK
jgi:F0F1-type ATP synthase assembly protein I